MVLPATILALAIATSACLTAEESPGIGPDFGGELEVVKGYTYGEFLEGTESVFTLVWDETEGAEWYEVRISPEPITADNYHLALPVDSVQGGDSATVIARVEVQPEVFQNACIGCGLCVEICPQDAMMQIDGRAVIDLQKCTSCGECVSVCPVQAITDSRFGVAYYFAVRAMGPGDAPSEGLAATTSRFRLRYANDEIWCGDCAYECFILLDSCGPGCPVDAVWYTPDWSTPGVDSGMVHIDYDLCIDCGQCFIQCHEYGLWSIKKEVVEE